jgi:hypothetical protein
MELEDKQATRQKVSRAAIKRILKAATWQAVHLLQETLALSLLILMV